MYEKQGFFDALPKMSNGDDLETGCPPLDHVSIPACIHTLLIFP